MHGLFPEAVRHAMHADLRVAREPPTAKWPAQSRDRKGADPSRYKRLGSAPLKITALGLRRVPPSRA